MSEMVIRVAKAMLGAFHEHAGPEEGMDAMARAAIAALREPTEAMVKFGDAVRGNHAADYKGGNGTENVFRAMIDEALR